MTDHALSVSCDSTGGGWRCTVVVGDDPAATEHVVEVDRVTLDDLAPGATPEELVRAFELPIIGRFFGDYPDEISRRMRGD